MVLSGPVSAGTAQAAVNVSALCDAAANEAARRTGVPLDVLRALALTESGRSSGGRMRAWPWTVNIGGEGYWFESRAKSEAFARRHHAAGARSFDIGCFQINFRWHGDAFDSIEQMFDPAANAIHAARFLNDLRAEFGSWEDAAGAYHSRTPDLAASYKRRFRTHLAAVAGDPPPSTRNPGTLPGAIRGSASQYPLLRAGVAGTLGSLVPASVAAGRGQIIQSTGLPLR